MGQIDRPIARASLLPHGPQIEEPSRAPDLQFTDGSDADPLVSARGIVNGMVLGAAIWAVILWALV